MSIACDFIEGCTDPAACNFNIDSNGDYVEADIMLEGYCLYLDNCGNCVPIGNQDCIEDCAGVYGGEHYINNCFDCITTATDNCVQGCAGEWAQLGLETIIDECGICGGTGPQDCQGHPVFCGDGTQFYCPQAGNDPNAYGGASDNCLEVDVCGVCGGDGDSCTASISFHSWSLLPDILTWGFGGELGAPPDTTHYYFNCPPVNADGTTTGCIDANFNSINNWAFLIGVVTGGEGFDTVDDAAPDLDIVINFNVYITRTVTFYDGVASGCDDIYDENLTGFYDASGTIAGGLFIMPITFEETLGIPPIDLFQDVEINGVNYSLNNIYGYDAVYDITITIVSFDVTGYTFENVEENVTVSDPINTIFAVHNTAIYNPCGGFPSCDVNHDGDIDCDDYWMARFWEGDGVLPGECDNYNENNPFSGADDGCCNFLNCGFGSFQQRLNHLLQLAMENTETDCGM